MGMLYGVSIDLAKRSIEARDARALKTTTKMHDQADSIAKARASMVQKEVELINKANALYSETSRKINAAINTLDNKRDALLAE